VLERVRNLWARRDLLLAFARKELKVRYKRTYLGAAWAVVSPLVMMLVLYLVFTLVFKGTFRDIKNYPLHLIVALVPWTFTTVCIVGSVMSVSGNASLIKKVYFPREVLPLATILADLYHFILALVVLAFFLLIFHAPLTFYILLFPVVFLVQLIFVVGASLLVAAMNVYFHDVRYIVQASILPWFYLTPIFYPMTMVPEKYRLWLYLNPMAGVVSMYRSILVKGEMFPLPAFFSALVIGLVVLILGTVYFYRKERFFADFL